MLSNVMSLAEQCVINRRDPIALSRSVAAMKSALPIQDQLQSPGSVVVSPDPETRRRRRRRRREIFEQLAGIPAAAHGLRELAQELKTRLEAAQLLDQLELEEIGMDEGPGLLDRVKKELAVDGLLTCFYGEASSDCPSLQSMERLIELCGELGASARDCALMLAYAHLLMDRYELAARLRAPSPSSSRATPFARAIGCPLMSIRSVALLAMGKIDQAAQPFLPPQEDEPVRASLAPGRAHEADDGLLGGALFWSLCGQTDRVTDSMLVLPESDRCCAHTAVVSVLRSLRDAVREERPATTAAVPSPVKPRPGLAERLGQLSGLLEAEAPHASLPPQILAIACAETVWLAVVAKSDSPPAKPKSVAGQALRGQLLSGATTSEDEQQGAEEAAADCLAVAGKTWRSGQPAVPLFAAEFPVLLGQQHYLRLRAMMSASAPSPPPSPSAADEAAGQRSLFHTADRAFQRAERLALERGCPLVLLKAQAGRLRLHLDYGADLCGTGGVSGSTATDACAQAAGDLIQTWSALRDDNPTSLAPTPSRLRRATEVHDLIERARSRLGSTALLERSKSARKIVLPLSPTSAPSEQSTPGDKSAPGNQDAGDSGASSRVSLFWPTVTLAATAACVIGFMIFNKRKRS